MKIILTLAIITFFIACEVSDSTTKNESKNVIITSSSFGLSNSYPAVWFSPSSGTTRPVDSLGILELTNFPALEEPIDNSHIVWIEPDDPEISFLSDEHNEKNGIKYLGKDASLFSTSTSTSDSGYVWSAKDSKDTMEVDDIYIIKTENSKCLIQVIELDSSDNYLSFEWLLL